MDTLEDPGLQPSSGDRGQQQRQLSKQTLDGEEEGGAACYWLSFFF